MSLHDWWVVHNVFKKADESDPYRIKDRQAKRDNERVRRIEFTFNKEGDYYVWREWTKERRTSVPTDAVHVTGRKRVYFQTDIWSELVWPKKEQSAIHYYLWMTNNHMDPDKITEKKKPMSEIDLRKLVIVGVAVLVIILIVPQFL